MKKVLFLLVCFFLTIAQAVAQGKTITGIVTDASTKEPLPSVAVVVKGVSGQGAVTDLNGKFTLKNVRPGATLVFSYMGYKKQEVAVGSQTVINVALDPEAKELTSVVVTALGIKRSQKALSYNVQEIKNDALTTVKDANFMNSLNGKVAGVNIQRSSAGVGGGTRVVMRGNKSIAGNNNVLYVVDGVPIGNQADQAGDGTSFGPGRTSSEGISNFNPEDIESISVLTGPSAAALYGASAANGVILINTKKGAAGRFRASFSTSAETAHPFILPRFQNIYGAKPNSHYSWGDKLATPSTHNVKDFFQTGTTFNNAFSFSTGTDKNQTYFSASALNSKGIVPNNAYHRYNASIRNTAKFLNDKLTLDVSASYIRDYANNMVPYGTYFNPIVGLYLYPRNRDFEQEKIFERYDQTRGYSMQSWSPGDLGMDIQNPYWIAYRNLRPEVKDRYMLSGLVKYDITKELNVAARARLDNTHSEREDKRYASTITTYAKPYGSYAYSNGYYKQKYGDIMVNYAGEIAKDLRLTANVGTSFEEYTSTSHGYGGDLLRVPNKFIFENIDATKASPSQGESRDNNFAIFASTELAWRNALYLTITGRTDKPSKLVNSSDPWIFYPSIGLSAIVTELISEDAKDAVRPYLSFLKVRGSYTEVGSPIPFAGLTPGTETRKLKGGKVEPFEYYPISNLKAERTRSYELGIDSRWFGGALSFAATIYQSNTYNQLLPTDLDASTGYKKLYVQAGNVRNRGIEMTLGFNKKFGEFEYGTNVTATANRNKIIKLGSGVYNPLTKQTFDLTDLQMGRFRLREGGEIGDVYATQDLARRPDGKLVYPDGQQLSTMPIEPMKLGSVNAKWNFGWKHNFAFKGFDLNVLFTARLGGIVISKTQATLDRYGVSQASADARAQGSVSIGPNFNVDPEIYYTAVSTLDSYYVYSATNVRLQELSLSYSLPKNFLQKTFLSKAIQGATLSVYGTNLAMIYNKAPYDPELTAGTGTFGQGYDNFMLPSQRTIGASLKLHF